MFVRSDGIYADWTICSPEVIHSWSYGTKKHYDEIIKDFQRQTDRKLDWHSREIYAYSQKNSIFTDFGGPTVDNHNFSLATFYEYLGNHLFHAANQNKKVFFNPDLPESEKQDAKHFQTDHPMYFNEE